MLNIDIRIRIVYFIHPLTCLLGMLNIDIRIPYQWMTCIMIGLLGMLNIDIRIRIISNHYF